MTATVVGPHAAGDPARYATLAATLATAVGLLCVVAWATRLGFLADLLSRPVLIGYLAGVALIMMVDQLPKLTGVDTAGSTSSRSCGPSSGTWRTPIRPRSSSPPSLWRHHRLGRRRRTPP